MAVAALLIRKAFVRHGDHRAAVVGNELDGDERLDSGMLVRRFPGPGESEAYGWRDLAELTRDNVALSAGLSVSESITPPWPELVNENLDGNLGGG